MRMNVNKESGKFGKNRRGREPQPERSRKSHAKAQSRKAIPGNPNLTGTAISNQCVQSLQPKKGKDRKTGDRKMCLRSAGNAPCHPASSFSLLREECDPLAIF